MPRRTVVARRVVGLVLAQRRAGPRGSSEGRIVRISRAGRRAVGGARSRGVAGEGASSRSCCGCARGAELAGGSGDGLTLDWRTLGLKRRNSSTAALVAVARADRAAQDRLQALLLAQPQHGLARRVR